MKSSVKKEVHAMHVRRSSDERVEIVAYLLKNRKVDESDYEQVNLQYEFIRNELKKRRIIVRDYGAERNKNDAYIKKEYYRLLGLISRTKGRQSTGQGKLDKEI